MNYIKDTPEGQYSWSKYFRVFEFITCVFSLAFSIYVIEWRNVEIVLKYAMLVTSIMYSIITAFDLIGYCTNTPITYKFMWILFAITAFAMFCVVSVLCVIHIVNNFWFHIGIAIFAITALAFLFDVLYVICKSDKCRSMLRCDSKTESETYILRKKPKMNTVHTSINEDILRSTNLCPCVRANQFQECKKNIYPRLNQPVMNKDDLHSYFLNKTTQTSRVSTAQKETATTQPPSMNYLSPDSCDPRPGKEVNIYENRGSILNVIRRSVSKMVGQRPGKETQTNELSMRTVEACDCTYCDVRSKPNFVVTTRPNNTMRPKPHIVVTEPAIHQNSTDLDDSSMFRAVNQLSPCYPKPSPKQEDCCHYTSVMKIWQEANSPYQVRSEQPEKSMETPNPDLLRIGDFNSTRIDIPQDKISIIKPVPCPTHRAGEEFMSLPSQTISSSSTPVIEYEEIGGFEQVTTQTSTTDLRKHILNESCCKESKYLTRAGTPPVFTARRPIQSPIYKSILCEARSDTSKT